MPWCLVVGACTNGKILREEVSESSILLGILGGSRDQDNVLLFSKGVMVLRGAVNNPVVRGIHDNAKFNASKEPTVAFKRKFTNRLLDWFDRTPASHLYVRICTSKYRDDTEPIYIPYFSSRGPAPAYGEIMMPNIVALGCCINSTWPARFPLQEVAI